MPFDLADDASDATLMARIAAGDRRAFDAFTRRHVAKCLAAAQRVLGNPSDAEDVVQDALLRVWDHAGQWTGAEARATTWLYRIVINLAIDRMRQSRMALAPLADGEATADPAPTPLMLLEAREVEAFIARAILALPARQCEALSLCYFEGLSCAEGARALGISVSAMEALLVRGRRTLRGSLLAENQMAGQHARAGTRTATDPVSLKLASPRLWRYAYGAAL
ncbi:MAG TPA: sigma-70 family RNA polymerase sigma factor [Alphaproteobacteria bacterium]